jgi:hypothetical protein
MREWQQAEAFWIGQRLPTQLFFGVTPEEYRSIKQRYLGLVTLVDQSIGAVLACLERFGLTDTRSSCTRAITATAWARITSSERNNVRRSHACSFLDSASWPDTRKTSATSQSHRFRADVA